MLKNLYISRNKEEITRETKQLFIRYLPEFVTGLTGKQLSRIRNATCSISQEELQQVDDSDSVIYPK